MAERFGKQHKNVLQDIEVLIGARTPEDKDGDEITRCSPEFSRLNFEPSKFESRGKKYPMLTMIRDGFTFLANTEFPRTSPVFSPA